MISELISKKELTNLIINEKKHYTEIAKMKGLDRKEISKIAKSYGIIKPKYYKIEDLQKYAKQKKGECLTKIYTNSSEKYKWKCEKNHKWEATWSSVVNGGTWCKNCATKKVNEKTKLTIGEMHEIAKKNGGKCLSKKYIRNSSKLNWECNDGHEFSMNAQTVKSGSWCPQCSTGISEKKCRYIFENIFDKKFFNTKKILENKYELDGFNEELKLAFEYQGEQHYRYIKTWHKSKEIFLKMQEIDQRKKELCRNKKIKLIEVPFWVSEKGDEFLFSYIKKDLEKLNFEVKNTYDSLGMEEMSFYPNKLEEMNEIAASKGGKCLSKKYLGAHGKLEFQCKRNHKWEATPDSIKNAKSWCRECFLEGVKQETLTKLKKIVIEKKGSFDERKFIKGKVKIEFKCEKNHKFNQTPSLILGGYWCKICGRKEAARKLRLDITEVAKLGQPYNCVLLTKEYVNSKTKVEWKCSKNHK